MALRCYITAGVIVFVEQPENDPDEDEEEESNQSEPVVPSGNQSTATASPALTSSQNRFVPPQPKKRRRTAIDDPRLAQALTKSWIMRQKQLVMNVQHLESILRQSSESLMTSGESSASRMSTPSPSPQLPLQQVYSPPANNPIQTFINGFVDNNSEVLTTLALFRALQTSITMYEILCLDTLKRYIKLVKESPVAKKRTVIAMISGPIKFRRYSKSSDDMRQKFLNCLPIRRSLSMDSPPYDSRRLSMGIIINNNKNRSSCCRVHFLHRCDCVARATQITATQLRTWRSVPRSFAQRNMLCAARRSSARLVKEEKEIQNLKNAYSDTNKLAESTVAPHQNDKEKKNESCQRCVILREEAQNMVQAIRTLENLRLQNTLQERIMTERSLAVDS
ncbi:hypothetical protein J6590_067332 [Homalodisca vitripennis]|nr:hypothetical protein J6590_067332 [Homalodisca vitripennis]